MHTRSDTLAAVVPLVVFITGWLLAIGALWRLLRRASIGGEESGPPTIIVPARNEADNVAQLMGPLRGLPVIVVDDHSDDSTAEVARSFGATVVTARPLPDGWRGKTWACHEGVLATDGPVLAFVDADVRVDAATLTWLADLAADGALVSVQPWHDAGPTFEQCSLIANMAALIGCGAFAARPTRRRVAFGPVLVTTRDSYERAGGFAAVAHETVEDVALARRYERVHVLSGRQVATFRMHRTVREFIDGWTRVLRRGVTAGSRFGVLATIVWIAALTAGITSPVLYVADVVLLAFVSRLAGRFRWYTALLYPIPLAVFVLLCLRSLLARRVRWRGRTISR